MLIIYHSVCAMMPTSVQCRIVIYNQTYCNIVVKKGL